MAKLGLTHVYTGDGKGKTSASMGLALRAVGQGLKVFVIQFMKGGAYTGEMISAKNFLPNIEFVQYGRHCIKEIKQLKLLGFETGHEFYDRIREDIECGTCRWCFVNDSKQAEFCRQAYEKAKDVLTSGEYDLVVLDEINVALHYTYVDLNRVLEIIKEKSPNTELVMSGRNAPQEVMDIADYVTVMEQVKHPFIDKKISARRGIEY
ncbi:cob(I)yrinic acid a,c-diamide adenosyltransferase [Candidatus Woesearchaeota archaeon]|nr:cob(I)yrinic acid a,c-diamide adenosyltransferase [Candidatus Woesearchaeota archaeon]